MPDAALEQACDRLADVEVHAHIADGVAMFGEHAHKVVLWLVAESGTGVGYHEAEVVAHLFTAQFDGAAVGEPRCVV